MSTVTRTQIDNRIDTVTYARIAGTTLTICAIKMVNGFSVTGESACVDPEEFDWEIGQKFAYEKAYNKLWELEGYLTSESTYQIKIGAGQ